MSFMPPHDRRELLLLAVCAAEARSRAEATVAWTCGGMASITRYEQVRYVKDRYGERIPNPDKPGSFLTEKTGAKAWRAQYYDREGKQHTRHFRRKVDAQAWLDDATTAMATGIWADPSKSKSTLASRADSWLAAHPNWTPSTRARNEGIVNKHILPRWGSVRLDKISTDAIQEWSASIDLAPGSVRKIVGVLTSILDRAVLTKHLAINPAHGVIRPKQPLKRRRYLNAIEVESLADAAGPYRDLILLLAYTGLRWGEVTALHVSSVDPIRRRLMIEMSVTEINGIMEWSDQPKDHQRRSVPYPAFLDTDITARIEGRTPDDLVFTSPTGGILRYGNARRDWFDPAVRAAALGSLTPHELRHTAASLAVKAGASVLALQRMLGHDKPSTTLDVYADLFDEDLDDVAAKLGTQRSHAREYFLSISGHTPTGG